MKYFAGWLYADEKEISKLKELGVFGLMVWKSDNGKITKALGKTGTLSHCYCNEETLAKLDELYGELWRTKYPHYNKYPSKYPSEHFSEIRKGNGENSWDRFLPND